jgi:hypothetical protein
MNCMPAAPRRLTDRPKSCTRCRSFAQVLLAVWPVPADDVTGLLACVTPGLRF